MALHIRRPSEYSLYAHGYGVSSKPEVREAVLLAAMKRIGSALVIKQLVELSIDWQERSPEWSQIALKDTKYIQDVRARLSNRLKANNAKVSRTRTARFQVASSLARLERRRDDSYTTKRRAKRARIAARLASIQNN